MGSSGISSKKSPRVVRGQLLLPTIGVTGGIVVGGDVALYRGAANQLFLGVGDMMQFLTNSGLYFRDTSIYVSSQDDGHLDLDADIAIDLNALAITLLNTATGSLPAGPEGSIAYDVTLHKLVVWTGAAWETVTSA